MRITQDFCSSLLPRERRSFLFVFFALALAFVALPQMVPAVTPAPDLQLNQTALSGNLTFGDLDVNTTTQRTLTIVNNGNPILTVSDITLPTGFTANWLSGTISSGASQSVVITFAPTTSITYSGTVTVVSDKPSGTNTMSISGTGTSRILRLSGNLAFGNVTTGQMATRQMTIANTGNRDLSISAVAYPPGFSGDFTGGAAPPTATIPRGNFALMGSGIAINSALLTNPYVDGISLRQLWYLFETADGVFDWTYFDGQVARCVAANMPVILRVSTGGDDASTTTTGGKKPLWLYSKITAAGGTFVTVRGKTIPVFWDATLIATKKAMYAAMCARYNGSSWKLPDGTPCVRQIQMCGCGEDSEDWSVSDVSPNKEAWLAAGWTDQKIVDLHVDLASAISLMQTFGYPFTPTGWAIDNPTNSTDRHQLEQKIITALRSAYGNRFIPMKDNLNALQGTTFPAGTNFDILYNNFPCATQDVWNVSSDITRYRYNGNVADNIHTIFGKGSDTLQAIEAMYSETYAADCLFDWTSVANADSSTPGRDETKYRHDQIMAIAGPPLPPPPSSGTIAPGASQVVNITFSPTAVQAYGGSIDFTSDKTSGTSTIPASGNGVSSATKVIQLTGDLTFGGVQTGTSVVRALTLTNSGNTALAVSGITFPSGFSGDWTNGTIAAGASQVVNVTFSAIAAQDYSGTVTVASDATGGINTTTASGTGVAPATKVIALSGNLAPQLVANP